MNFLKKTFYSDENKKKKDSKKIESLEEENETINQKKVSNEYLNKLNVVIEEAKNLLSKTPKIGVIQDDTVYIVERFFYANLINNFRDNLTEDNLKEFNISKSDMNNISKEFKEIFKNCDIATERNPNKDKIDYRLYQEFKRKLTHVSKSAYKLLLELERHIDIDSCERSIDQFKKETKTLGKELKIQKESGNISISIGFEGDDEEDYDNNLEEEKITNFNNFSIDIDDEWITLEDEDGYFHGLYYLSKNKKYLVAYADAHGEIDKEGRETTISGQVYLIKDNNKIMWQRNISRPNDAFVSDNGTVIVIDYVSYEQTEDVIYFINSKGQEIFKYEFNANIGGQGFSEKHKLLIVTTCFPEDKIYCFDFSKNKLLWMKNIIQKYVIGNIRFGSSNEIILSSNDYKDSYAIDLNGNFIEESIKESEQTKYYRLSGIGFGLFYDKKYNEAENVFISCLKTKKQSPSLLNALAKTEYKLDKFQESLNFWKQSILLSKSYNQTTTTEEKEIIKSLRKLIDANIKKGNQKEIIKIYNEMKEFCPNQISKRDYEKIKNIIAFV